jgi:hypothetical protein
MVFKPGQSGNPAGPPTGRKKSITMLSDEILNDACKEIMESIRDRAIGGDPTAMQVTARYFGIVRKGRRVNIGLPTINTPEDVLKALQHIQVKVAQELISAEEAQDFIDLVRAQQSAIETVELVKRIAALEQGFALPPPPLTIEHQSEEVEPCPSDP